MSDVVFAVASLMTRSGSGRSGFTTVPSACGAPLDQRERHPHAAVRDGLVRARDLRHGHGERLAEGRRVHRLVVPLRDRVQLTGLLAEEADVGRLADAEAFEPVVPHVG